MNKVLTKYIFLATVLLISSAAMAQRQSGDEGGTNATTEHVIVGGNVFGGGKLAPVSGNTEVIINQRGATVDSSVYGGGALANVGTDNNNTTRVELLDGIINGNVYGGGLGDSIGNGYFGESNVAALVFGKVFVEVGLAPDDPNNPNTNGEPDGNITINGDVFGCNNINGTPKDDVRVNIYRTAHTDANRYPDGVVTLDELDSDSYDANYDQKFAINAVYGGGNRASYLPNAVASGATLHNTTVYVWGCTENTVKTVYGGGNAANVGTPTNIVNTNILIDGGRFDRVFGGGNGYSADHNHDKPYKQGDDCTATPTDAPCEDYNPGANIYGTASTTIIGGLARQVFGASNQYGNLNSVVLNIDKHCDTLLIFETFGGGNEADITGNLTTTLGCSNYMIGTFYGGSNLADVTGDVTLNVEGGNYINVFGGSKGRLANTSVTPQITEKAANINGTVTLNLHGGKMVNAFGGNDVKGRISGLITVNLLQQGDCGLQVDTIYGGGRDAEYAPDSISGKKIISPLVNLLHGTVGHQEGANIVHGCVFGGGKGTTAVVTAHPKVTIGDVTTGDEHQVIVLGSTIGGGSVFGGGNAAEVDGVDSVLMVKSNSLVVNLFGGGNKAIADTAVVIMTAGTVDTIFGGGNLAGLGNTETGLGGIALINVSGGLVQKGIYGGSNKEGTIVDDITVNVSGNAIIGAVGATANIHGGGYGAATRTNANVTVNFGDTPDTQSDFPKLYGDLYGGSALGEVNNESTDSTVLNILNGTLYGNIYGGGLGQKNGVNGASSDILAKVYGKVFVNVGDLVGGVLKGNASFSDTTAIFGCNNLNGSPVDSVFVNIYKTAHGSGPENNEYPIGANITTVAQLAANSLEQTYAIPAVFGGGNLATYTPVLNDNNKPKSATVHVYGCQNNTIKEVYGGGNAADVGTDGDDGISANTFVIIDGGRINRVFGGGRGDNTATPQLEANINGTATTTIYAGLIDTIFGGGNMKGDIDSISLILAHNTNCADEVFNQVFGGANEAALTCNLNTTINCGVEEVGDIYGGSNLANIGGDVTLNIIGGRYNTVFGGSKGKNDEGGVVSADIGGDVLLNLNGGTMVNAFGGSNVKGNINGGITVNVLDLGGTCGLQVDTIYGGGQEASYTPGNPTIAYPLVNLLHGTVGHTTGGVTTPGCVFGGGKGAGATVTANPKVIIGDTEHPDNKITVLNGHVFGGGNLASVVGIDSVLMVKANSEVVNLYGGGNKAPADNTVVIVSANAVLDTIFGGGNMAGLTGTALVNVSNGSIKGGIYGGSDKSGNVVGDITVNVTGGSIGCINGSTTRANIHGGGYGNLTSTSGNVTVNYGTQNTTYSSYPTLMGDLYGGSALGNVGAEGKTTTVNVINGSITGDVYGGGLGSDTYAAAVNGNVEVYIGKVIDGTLYNTAVINTYDSGNSGGNVFGCNNVNGAPVGTVKVDFIGGTVTNIFGGGNLAQYTGDPIVNIINGTVSGNVYGGGKGVLVDGEQHGVKGKVTGNPQVTVGDNNSNHTAHVTGDVYGGGDAANVAGTPVVVVNDCNTTIGYLYGGGNAADVTGTNVTVNAVGSITQAFGGGHGDRTATAPAKYADVNGNAVFNVYGGTISQVFAGSNSKGAITGTSTLNINKIGSCAMKLGEVYGGGNLAEGNAGTINIGCTGDIVDGTDGHLAHPENIGTTLEGIGTVYGGANAADIGTSENDSDITLNINSGIINRVFGGNNNSGIIYGDIQVNIEKTSETCGWYVGEVYGGGDHAPYSRTPDVNIIAGTVYRNVFGGGNDITSDDPSNPTYGVGGSDVEMTGGIILLGVYGGCNLKGTVTGNSQVKIYGGEVGSYDLLFANTPTVAQVFGGGLGEDTRVKGNVTVIVDKGQNVSVAPNIYGDVYGGSAYGMVNDEASDKTIVNIYDGHLYSKHGVGQISETETYTIYNGGNVYGGGLGQTGNTTKGKVNGEVIVNIGSSAGVGVTSHNGNATIDGSVYGCNNSGGSPQDNVTVNIYGTAHSTTNYASYTGSDATFAIANVFGGGNEADYVPANGKNSIVNIFGCQNTVERVFGGGNAAATPDVVTNIEGGRMDQVFGGGNGERGVAYGADIHGDVDLGIHGGNVGQFFGGSNRNGNIFGVIRIVVDDEGPCPDLIIDEFFCGGNYANIIGGLSTDITCTESSMVINNLYGGCNMAEIWGDVVLNLLGGTYINVYGGSKGDRNANKPADIHKYPTTMPDQTTSPELYEYMNTHGGAGVLGNTGGNVTLNLCGGTMVNAYGGNNIYGNIEGLITVNVLDTVTNCPLQVDTIYGGGHDAEYTPTHPENTGTPVSPMVNVMHGTVGHYDGENHLFPGCVFGGGKGATATVTANPRVIIGDEESDHTAVILGNVFGGGNLAAVVGIDSVLIQNSHSIADTIFGGGNLAAVSGSNVVTIVAGTVNYDVYGGGALANTGGSKVTLAGGTVTNDIYGGGLGDNNHPAAVNGAVQVIVESGTVRDVFGCNNINGAPTGNVNVDIYNNVTRNVYGGGNQAAGTVSPVVYIHKGTVGGNVYGGGLGSPAILTGAPSVTVGDLTTGSSDVAVVTHDVYGGGDMANVVGTTTVLVQKCNSRAKYVYGGGNAADVSGTQVFVTGGIIDTIFGGGHGDNDPNHIRVANVNGNDTVSITGGTIGKVFSGSNLNGNISGRMALNIDKSQANDACDMYIGEAYGGGNMAAGKAGTITVGCTGTWTENHNNHNTTNNRIGYELEGIGTVYGGANMADINNSNIVLVIEGGIIDTVFGGNNQSGDINGSIRVDINKDNSGTCANNWYVGSVYGGGNLAAYSSPTDGGGAHTNYPEVNILNGIVSYNVYGGGLGASATVTGNPVVKVNGGTVNGNTFGGGDAAAVTGNTNVQLISGTVNNAFGGGNVADINGTTTLSISGASATNLYGGGNLASVTSTTSVSVSNGTVSTGVYGGCNVTGNVGGNITVSVTGGTIGATGEGNAANVHGGGYGNQTTTGGDVEVTINGASANIYGDVYGGSALGNVNDAASDQTNVTLSSGTIHGDLYGGGLGSTAPNYPAAVNGAVQVTVNGGTVTGSVYGCNNLNGAPQSTVKVDVFGTDPASSTYALGNVFGGGNLAAFNNTPEVTIHNCANSIGYVYGGGNKASVGGTKVDVYGGNTIGNVFAGGNGDGLDYTYTMVTGNAIANIYGGTIGKVFGGNNNRGVINGPTIQVNVNKQTESGEGHTSCDMKIGEVYGGGNLAHGKAANIIIGCTGTWTNTHNTHNTTTNRIGYELEGIGTVYGGANEADINSDSNPIVLNINDGIIDTVFGGNNKSGAINVTIQVNIEKTGNCDWFVGDVYGGGNHAYYVGKPDVNIIAGTVSRNVFGGGNDITDGTKGVTNSDVEMTGGTVLLGVYGGCNLKGTVTENSLVKIYDGTIGSQSQLAANPRIVAQVFGGGLGQNTNVNGDVEVNFGTPSDTHSEFPKLYGDIYGGSALGNVNTNNTNTTTVNILNGTIETVTSDGTTANGQHYYIYHGGNVYGGGLGEKIGVDGGTSNIEAKVNGVVFVNIGTHSRSGRDLNPEEDLNVGRATIKGNVYGCNNTNGSPQDSVTVHIYRTHRGEKDEVTYHENDATFAIPNVFGGGNRADFKPAISGRKLKVWVHGCYNTIERVFGGSNAAAAGNSGTAVVVNTLIDGGRFDHVFGGGNGEVSAADIFGDVDLEIHGGYVEEFYVGSNQQGSISGVSNVLVDQSSGCEEIDITEFFCGGKYADFFGNINVTIKCSDGLNVNDLYGGCKEAKVRKYPPANTPGLSPELVALLTAHPELVGTGGNIHLIVKGGTYDHIYGGSKGKANNPNTPEDESISADIEGNVLLEVFGGTVMDAIFGGCNILGDIAGKVIVNVEDGDNEGCALDVSIADVYGGGNKADYNTTEHAEHDYPQVNIRNATVKNVFGGGLEAKVTGNPKVKIKKGSKVLGNVYGGGNMGEVVGSPKVTIDGKDNSESPHTY